MTFLARAVAIVLSFSCLQAEDAPVADPDLPQPLDFSYANDLLVHPPFTRTVSLEDTFRLTGVAYVDGHPVATVLNTQTKQSVVVTEEPNAIGLRLVAANAGGDLEETQVEMQVGAETMIMHYQGQQLAPTGAVNDSKSRMASSERSDKDSKFRASSFLGEHGKEMYSALSSDARDKFKDLIKSRMEKHPELTPEQNADYARKIYAKIKATDQGAPSVKPPKSSKPSKIKQGA